LINQSADQMRNAFITLLVLLSVNTYAQHLTLSGTLPDLANKKLVVQFLDHTKAEIPVDAAGKFSSTLNLETGYYNLKDLDLIVYLEPDMDLSIIKSGKRFIFSGKGSTENSTASTAAELAAFYFPLKNNPHTPSINFIEPNAFATMLNTYQVAALKLVNNTAASDYFKRTQKECIANLCKRLTNDYVANYGVDTAKKQIANNLQFEYYKKTRLGTDDKELLAAYKQAVKDYHVKTLSPADSARFDVLTNFDLNNELAYQCSAEYRALFEKHFIDLDNKMYALDRKISGKDLWDKVINTYIKSIFLKQELQYRYVLDRFSLKRDIEQTYKEYLTSGAKPEYINDVKALYTGGKTLNGSVSPDFNYADVNGKMTSLSRMRGSYVYIDFWATYCIPCIGQIPSLKVLEEKYRGKNVKFVSISVDAKTDELKWKKFVAENKLGGTQLIAYDKGSDFHNFLNVSGIPRFVLIDPNGIIVSQDAFKPGEPEIQEQIDGLLAKK